MIEIQMKLTRQQEIVISAGLIVYLTFIPEPEPLRAFLSSNVGKVIFLTMVAYKILCVSPTIGVLLALVYARHQRDNVWEHLDVAPKQCKCKNPGFNPNNTNSACINKDGKEDTSMGSIMCLCPDGYAWDLVKKECKPNQTNQTAPVAPVDPGIPPPPPGSPGTSSTPAPATGGTVTNTTLPMTTGSAAAQAMSSAGPQTPPTGGAQPATTTSSTVAPV
jgi:hypothetical protein